MLDEEQGRLHPSKTDRLFGHEAAQRLFLSALDAERMHHAWLISGPKGVGKATFAWQCAKYLLSHDDAVNSGDVDMFGAPTRQQALESDADSPIIQRIKAGGHPGVMALERSMNEKTGKQRKDIVIDDVRKLIGFFSQTSTDGGWRIAIIDAVDEMNVNAANALLKLLEEPPAKTILLLIAHAPGRLLPTIKSRCRQLALKPLGADVIDALVTERFPDLAGQDIIDIVSLAEGAPGRALELVDMDGIATIRKLDTALQGYPAFDMPFLHALAVELSAPKADRHYALFIETYLKRLQQIIREISGASSAEGTLSGHAGLPQPIINAAGLDNWFELWEKTHEILNRADAVNLDRKQVIISLFARLRALK